MRDPTPNAVDANVGPAERTGPIGRAARVLLEVGFVYGFATLVDQGGPAAVRDPDTLTGDAAFVVLTIAMVALYAVLVGKLAKIVAGEPVAKRARSVALAVLGAAAAVAAIVGELRAGAVSGRRCQISSGRSTQRSCSRRSSPCPSPSC